MSEAPQPANAGAYQVAILDKLGPARDRCEEELLTSGAALPLPHRSIWARRWSPGQWFVAIRTHTGRCVAGFGVDIGRSHVLPGHRLLRVDRLGTGMPVAALEAGLHAVAHRASADSRVLRLTIQCFSPNPEVRRALENVLRTLGFVVAREPKMYAVTLWWHLTTPEEALLASLSRRTRRDIRYGGKPPLRLESLEDPRWIPRLDALHRETMARTGGTVAAPPWKAIQDLTRAAPEASCLVGLVRTDRPGPEALLSFAWGCNHGTYAHYDLGGSTRDTDLKTPLGYALVWELGRWAAATGAQGFDLGGVTVAAASGPDSLQGISDFKRHFSDTVLEVASEWQLEPHPLRSRMAGVIRAVARTVTGRP